MPQTPLTYSELHARAVDAAEQAVNYQNHVERCQNYAKVAEVYARLAHTASDRELRNRGA